MNKNYRKLNNVFKSSSSEYISIRKNIRYKGLQKGIIKHKSVSICFELIENDIYIFIHQDYKKQNCLWCNQQCLKSFCNEQCEKEYDIYQEHKKNNTIETTDFKLDKHDRVVGIPKRTNSYE